MTKISRLCHIIIYKILDYCKINGDYYNHASQINMMHKLVLIYACIQLKKNIK